MALKRLAKADPPISLPRGPLYLTDAQVSDAGIAGDAAAQTQAIGDAQALYGFVADNPWTVDADALAQFAESAWKDEGPDRLRVALSVLTSTGRLIAVE